MLVRVLFTATAFTLISLSPSAAESIFGDPRPTDGPYIGLSAGLLVITAAEGHVAGLNVDGEYDEGFAIGVQLGYKRSVLRAEVEIEYGRAGVDSWTFTEQTTGGSVTLRPNLDADLFRATGSIYYDFDNLTRLTPYFGGGLGVVYVDVDEETVTDPGTGLTFTGDSDAYFTVHGEVGVSVDITDRWALVPAYRFIWFNSGSGGIEDDTAHLFKLGTRFRF